MNAADPAQRPAEAADSRGRDFFWLGVFVLPLFWSWFTLSKTLARGEAWGEVSGALRSLPIPAAGIQ
ncbi:hypothetical protein [Prosthecobacter fluviatilis]|uniref:Uncharacterized protein n=1 Tax=Prosthecobacter fluviatilis TaxID=445931 RepID=A0ABW0KXY6_9BACT